MEQSITKLKALQDALNAEWERYNQAMRNDSSFAETKDIYLHIKNLQQEIGKVIGSMQEKLNMQKD